MPLRVPPRSRLTQHDAVVAPAVLAVSEAVVVKLRIAVLAVAVVDVAVPPRSGLGRDAARFEQGGGVRLVVLALIAGPSRRDDRVWRLVVSARRHELRRRAGELALEVKGLGLEVLVLGAGLRPEPCVVLDLGALDPEFGLGIGDLGLELVDPVFALVVLL